MAKSETSSNTLSFTSFSDEINDEIIKLIEEF